MAEPTGQDLDREVVRTLLSLRASGDLVAPTTTEEAETVAALLVGLWSEPPAATGSSPHRLVEALARALRDHAGFGVEDDLPLASYHYVATAVAETIRRGFHLDPLPPGATGFVSHGAVPRSLGRQFHHALGAAAGSMGYRFERHPIGQTSSFECFALSHRERPAVWVLAHLVIPVFAATPTEPTWPHVVEFINADACLQAWYAPWRFLPRSELDAPLTRFVTSRLTVPDLADIRRHACGTVGTALFNLWD